MKRQLFAIQVYLIIISLIITSCAKKTDFKINLKNDQSFIMSYQSDMKMNQKTMGVSIDLNTIIGFEIKFKNIKQDKNRDYFMLLNYETLKYQMKSKSELIEFGNENAGNDSTFVIMFQKIKDISFYMKISEYGEIIEVTGLDSLISELVERNIRDTNKIKEFSKIFAKNFGEESIKNSLKNFFSFYPQKPVSIKDKWNSSYLISSFFSFKTDNTFQLTESKDGLSKIIVNSNMKTDEKTSSIDIKNFKMTFNLKGEQTGTFIIDEKTAWINQSEIKQNIYGDATASKAGNAIFTIPYTIENTLKISIKK